MSGGPSFKFSGDGFRHEGRDTTGMFKGREKCSG